jgi:hypothetical protein
MKCEKEGFLKFLPRILRPAVRNFRLLNSGYGHFRTMRQHASVDRDGNPIPWYTYPAIEYVKQLDLRERVVFEYGAGYSSLFYAKRCKRITSVEDNLEWHRVIKLKAPPNCDILCLDTPEEYVHAIDNYPGLFDIIIIDGSHRELCCEAALERVKDTGFIILDNSDMLPDCVRVLGKRQFIQVDMVGFGPENGYLWATSFFLARGFDFKPCHAKQPTLSVGP